MEEILNMFHTLERRFKRTRGKIAEVKERAKLW
jgi:hypothetical protein